MGKDKRKGSRNKTSMRSGTSRLSFDFRASEIEKHIDLANGSSALIGMTGLIQEEMQAFLLPYFRPIQGNVRLQ
jgi:hypothetical protein